MQNMRLYIFWFALIFLSGCCRNAVCECLGNWHDAVGFQFVKLPSEGGFSDNEVDTVILYRMDTANIVLDSVQLYKDTTRLDEYVTFDSTHYLLILGGWLGIYGAENKIDVNQHYFRISLLDGTHFDITDINIQNETYQQSKCCECSRNIQKTLKINGIAYNLTGKEELGEIAIPLKQ